MSILIINFIAILSILLSKYLFKKWFNHLFLYTISWDIFLTLYQLKFINYNNISNEAFIIFFIVHMSVIAGALTVFLARKVTPFNSSNVNNTEISSIFFDNDFRIIRMIIILVSFAGLFSAYQNWSYLLEKFGSFTAIMIRAHTIYRLRIAGELNGGTPYLSILPYIGVIFSGIYTAIKNKITLYTFLPIFTIIVSDIASIGRGGIFVGFIMLVTSFILYQNFLSKVKIQGARKNKKALIFGGLIVIILVFGSLNLIIELRGRFEEFKGKTRSISQFDDVPFLSASEYFYFSSNVGVFSKYFESQDEKTMFGENSFLPIYNFLSKFNFTDHPSFYPRGYRIPAWSNSATYLRDLHADFGDIGMILIPYFLSLFTTYFWFRFFSDGDFKSFVCLVYLFVTIALSVFNMQTRSAFFLLSFFITVILIILIEKFHNKTINYTSVYN